jgi:hypothetical protein
MDHGLNGITNTPASWDQRLTNTPAPGVRLVWLDDGGPADTTSTHRPIKATKTTIQLID